MGDGWGGGQGADALRASLSEPVRLPGQRNQLVTVTASIGVALSQSDTRRGSDVLRSADSAMYRAKRIDDAETTLAFAEA